MTQNIPSTPDPNEPAKRGPGRPRKEESDPKYADAPEGLRLRSVYFINSCHGDGLDSWISNLDWATVLPANHACGGCDWIVLVGGHTVILKKNGRRVPVPWSGCKNGVELDVPLTMEELAKAAR